MRPYMTMRARGMRGSDSNRAAVARAVGRGVGWRGAGWLGAEWAHGGEGLTRPK